MYTNTKHTRVDLDDGKSAGIHMCETSIGKTFRILREHRWQTADEITHTQKHPTVCTNEDEPRRFQVISVEMFAHTCWAYEQDKTNTSYIPTTTTTPQIPESSQRNNLPRKTKTIFGWCRPADTKNLTWRINAIINHSMGARLGAKIWQPFLRTRRAHPADEHNLKHSRRHDYRPFVNWINTNYQQIALVKFIMCVYVGTQSSNSKINRSDFDMNLTDIKCIFS